jgi:hypothetical protein
MAFMLIGVPLFAIASCMGTGSGTRETEADGQMPTAYAGITTVGLTLEIAKAVDAGDSNRTRDAIDSQLVQALGWISEAPADVRGEESFRKGRDRLVTLVKTRWLAQPPQFLDAGLENFVNSVCEGISDCPRGDIQQESTGEQYLKGTEERR